MRSNGRLLKFFAWWCDFVLHLAQDMLDLPMERKIYIFFNLHIFNFVWKHLVDHSDEWLHSKLHIIVFHFNHKKYWKTNKTCKIWIKTWSWMFISQSYWFFCWRLCNAKKIMAMESSILFTKMHDKRW